MRFHFSDHVSRVHGGGCSDGEGGGESADSDFEGVLEGHGDDCEEGEGGDDESNQSDYV